MERMGKVMASRTARDGTGPNYRNANPTAVLLLDTVELEAGGVGKEGLQMARGRSHLPLNNRTFIPFYVLGNFGDRDLH